MIYNNQLDYLKKYAIWEEKRKLFDWKIYEINVWEYIRFSIFEIIDSKLLNISYYSYYYYIKENNSCLIKRIIEELPKKIIKKKEVLFVNMSRRQLINGVYVSPFVDGLVENLNIDYYILEARRKSDRNIKIKTRNVIFYEPENLAGKIKNDNKINYKVNKLISLIEKDFNIKMTDNDKNYILKNCYSIIQNKKLFQRYYELILNIISPKVIVIIGAAIQYNRYLIETAKKLGITTVEYDHGFNNACCMENYYYRKRDLKSYVDYKWTYGDAIHYSLRLPIDSCKIISVGNLYHEQRVLHFKKNMKEINKYKDKKNILIISDFNVTSNLDILAYELTENLSQSNYRIIFKLHPGEVDWKNKYPILVNSKVNVKGFDNKEDIYYYISQADYIIGTVSTALSEAVDFNCRIFIYKKSFNSIFSEFLYNNGYAELVDNIEQIIQNLNDSKKNCDGNLYKKYVIKNVKDQLELLIKNNRAGRLNRK